MLESDDKRVEIAWSLTDEYPLVGELAGVAMFFNDDGTEVAGAWVRVEGIGDGAEIEDVFTSIEHLSPIS